MRKMNFVKTLVPKGQYKEKEEREGVCIVHLDGVLNEEMDAYECVECSMPVSEYSETAVNEAYAAWKAATANRGLARAKREVLKQIDAYDTSSAVNGFVLNGMLIPWSKNDPNSPNVEKRMGLRQNIADKVALGEENIDIWLKGMSFTMSCAQAEALLRSIENYAYECFNVTASHKQAVSELTTIEEVEAYNYKAGYPKMLEMSI